MGDRAFDLEAAIRAESGERGIALDSAALTVMAGHARTVLAANRRAHLTAITDPREFVVRHIGEALAGAAMLAVDAEGRLLDLGSGNGYPGLAVVAARPGLRPVLAEATERKARFLEGVLSAVGIDGRVLHAHVARAADLQGHSPFRVVVTRAMGGWERILPRLATALTSDGEILLWAGEAVEATARRAAWRSLRLTDRVALHGRERSWIWRFRAVRQFTV